MTDPVVVPVTVAAAGGGLLRALAGLSADRLATARVVAAAKWESGGPIDDPGREREVLASVRALAARSGADPEAVVRVLRDQIEAHKTVQRALHRHWRAHPRQAPAHAPDLAGARQEIDRVNEDLVRLIARSAGTRAAPSCPSALAVAVRRTARSRHLDPLHTRALTRAVRSLCTPGPLTTTTPDQHHGTAHANHHNT
ncbi:hypothetical protein Misp01_72670 [Microtetraspora sp. NBRC 13810]|uniref:chorismate mutase n=1 Tax=Microtetraspora sp. NBRC 13810 TaxID=3030990 RepID=UPI0024A54739|nr:chorismate mutase [Microtetraspora sp. NBRC 13810]GLW12139.1 hypothetical protein Misp01_72670 [Microtetraspora sp. NBRC 13810]